jgi:propionyl-CoA carboxylase alpha chain
MIKAIEDYHVEGVQTTLAFGKFVLNMRLFVLGILIHFVKNIIMLKC